MPRLHPQTFTFLRGIKNNNNKAWFEKNKPRYLEIRGDVIAFIEALIKEVSKFDPGVAATDPKKSVMRIYRDIRFSKDKTPYKVNIGAGLSSGAGMGRGAGYYLHLQPGANFIGGGIWMPDAPVLHKIRQEIDYNFNDFRKIVEGAAFRKTFGGLSQEQKLTRPPKNYSADNPAIEYLLLKSFTCSASFTDDVACSDHLLKTATNICKHMHPLIRFLNQAVE